MNSYKTSNIQYIVSSSLDSGAGIESPTYMVCFSPSIGQGKQFYNCGASICGGAIMNRQILYVFTDAC